MSKKTSFSATLETLMASATNSISPSQPVKTCLHSIGSTVKLHTYVVYREDSQSIYAFSQAFERDLFKLLIQKVSGIGPKIALSILSKMNPNDFIDAVAQADITLLSQCPGIGKKTAERLTLELKDKIPAPAFLTKSNNTSSSSSIASSQVIQDATSALVALGFKENIAQKSVEKSYSKLSASTPDSICVESLVKSALA